MYSYCVMYASCDVQLKKKRLLTVKYFQIIITTWRPRCNAVVLIFVNVNLENSDLPLIIWFAEDGDDAIHVWSIVFSTAVWIYIKLIQVLDPLQVLHWCLTLGVCLEYNVSCQHKGIHIKCEICWLLVHLTCVLMRSNREAKNSNIVPCHKRRLRKVGLWIGYPTL